MIAVAFAFALADAEINQLCFVDSKPLAAFLEARFDAYWQYILAHEAQP